MKRRSRETKTAGPPRGQDRPVGIRQPQSDLGSAAASCGRGGGAAALVAAARAAGAVIAASAAAAPGVAAAARARAIAPGTAVARPGLNGGASERKRGHQNHCSKHGHTPGAWRHKRVNRWIARATRTTAPDRAQLEVGVRSPFNAATLGLDARERARGGSQIVSRQIRLKNSPTRGVQGGCCGTGACSVCCARGSGRHAIACCEPMRSSDFRASSPGEPFHGAQRQSLRRSQPPQGWIGTNRQQGGAAAPSEAASPVAQHEDSAGHASGAGWASSLAAAAQQEARPPGAGVAQHAPFGSMG